VRSAGLSEWKELIVCVSEMPFGMSSAFGRVAKWKPQQAALALAVLMVVTRWYKSLREEIRLAKSLDQKHPVFELWKKKSKALRDGYTPPALLSLGSKFVVGSIHTVVHNVLRRIKPVEEVHYDRELFELECGGTVGIDWALRCGSLHAEHKDSDAPIVLLHHGLTGCSKSHYVQSVIAKLLEEPDNLRVCVMVARGCGGIELTTPLGFTAHGYDDMRQVVDHLKERNPNAKIYGVGFSLGAGLMANYIGRSGRDCKLSGAAVLSPSWDFSKTTSCFDIWSRKFLAANLKEYFEKNKAVVEQHEKIDFDKCMEAVTVREFDTHAVVPAFGFKDVDHYYETSSAISHAHEVHIPTLSFSADDDPVCCIEGAENMEREKRLGPGLVIARTYRGGHVSWAEGILGYDSFMDRLVVEWLRACREHDKMAPSTAKPSSGDQAPPLTAST